MEDIKKLLQYIEPAPQNLIVVSGRGSKLHTKFNPPLEYNHNNVGYELCLIRLERQEYILGLKRKITMRHGVMTR